MEIWGILRNIENNCKDWWKKKKEEWKKVSYGKKGRIRKDERDRKKDNSWRYERERG